MFIRRNQITKTKEEIETFLSQEQARIHTLKIPKYNSFDDYNYGISDILKLALTDINTIKYDDCCGETNPDDIDNTAYLDVSNSMDWLMGKNDNFPSTIQS